MTGKTLPPSSRILPGCIGEEAGVDLYNYTTMPQKSLSHAAENLKMSLLAQSSQLYAGKCLVGEVITCWL